MIKLPARLRSSAICSSLGSKAKQRTVKASGKALRRASRCGRRIGNKGGNRGKASTAYGQLSRFAMQRLLILGAAPAAPSPCLHQLTNSLAALLKLCIRLGHVLHVRAVHHANHAQHPPVVVQRGQRRGLQRHVLLHTATNGQTRSFC